MSVLLDVAPVVCRSDSGCSVRGSSSFTESCEVDPSNRARAKSIRKIGRLVLCAFSHMLGDHPFLGVLQSPAKDVIHTHFGVAASCSAVRAISEKVEAKLMEGSRIERPAELLLDHLTMQKFFGKYLLYKGVDKRGFPKLAWSDTRDGFSGEGDLLYPDVLVREEHLSQAVKTIDSLVEMNLLFLYFKSLVPHKFTKDGCDPRCLWITFTLQKILKVEGVSKAKVWAKDGATAFELSSAFPRERWTMHTAPVVQVGSAKYVLDLSLPYPMPLEEWLANLHPRSEDLLVAYSDHWDLPCLPADGSTPYKETLDRVLEDMQALYLHEMVDGAIESLEWSRWAKGERGLGPVGEVVCLESTECDVIINASGRVKKMAWREDFVERDGRYYLNDRVAAFFS